jgi:ethanolamine utilization protein EutN
MQLALVIGRATATIKHGSLRGQKLLLVQRRTADPARPDGPPLLVVDALGAGIGQTVMISNSPRGVRELLGSDVTPVGWMTLGIKDA